MKKKLSTLFFVIVLILLWTFAFSTTILAECNPDEHDWCYEDGICTICGSDHNHNWTNEDGICTVCQYACPHSWDAGVCIVCDFTCPHNGTPQVLDDGDDDYHYIVCDLCTYTLNSVAHTYDSSTHACTVCEHACGHNFVAGVCSFCDYECPHDGATYVVDEGPDSYHCVYCSICDFNFDTKDHSYDANSKCTECGHNCTHDASFCDEIVGDDEEHNVRCFYCETILNTDTHNYMDGECDDCWHVCSHNWSDNNGICKICTTICLHENGFNYSDYGPGHTATCADCGWVSDEYSDMVHDWNDGVCSLCDRVCTHSSWNCGYCMDCNSACPHDGETYPSDCYGDYEHAVCCSICNEIIDYEGHSFDANHICTICDHVCTHGGTSILPDDDYNHQTVCMICDAIVELTPHSYTDGFCATCYYYCTHINYTCTSNGTTTHTFSCNICDFENEENHTFSGGVCPKCSASEAFRIDYVTNGGNNVPFTESTMVVFPITNPTKYAHYFAGWFLDEDFNTPATAGTTLTAAITLYAKFIPFIGTQPSASNDFTVVPHSELASLVTYQWNKLSGITALVADDIIGLAGGTLNGTTITNDSNTMQITLTLDTVTNKGNCVKVTSADELTGYTFKIGNDYYYTVTIKPSKFGFSAYVIISSSASSLTLTNVSLANYVEVAGETSSRLGYSAEGNPTGLVLEDAYYLCILYAGQEQFFTDIVHPVQISFSANGGETTPPTALYQLQGRAIVLPTDVLVKANYSYLGWNTTDNATTALSTYNAPATDTTLYAVWQAKTAISITESAQTYTYGDTVILFAIKGSHKDLAGYTVSYYVGNAWTTIAPTNVGSYNVKIARAEDGTYASYEKTVNNGLVINKGQTVISVSTTPIVITYGETLNLPTPTTNFGAVTAVSSAMDFTPAGQYSITYSVADTDNYYGDTKTLIITVNKKEVQINWGTTSWTYQGKKQTPVITYKDKNGADIPLAYTVTKNSAPADFCNAGEYVLSVAFAESDTESKNYQLPALSQATYLISATDVVIDKKPIEDATPDETHVDIIEGELATGIVVVIEKDTEKTDSVIAKEVRNAVSKKSQIFAKFDISLEDENGMKVENLGNNLYRITLSIPEELRGKEGYALISISDDGKITKIDAEWMADSCTFVTSSFAKFAIVADKQGSLAWLIILLILLVLLLLVLVLYILWKMDYESNQANQEAPKKRKLQGFDKVFTPVNKLLKKKKSTK